MSATLPPGEESLAPRPAPIGAARALALVRAARPHQWLKNLLVLVAPVLAHRVDAPTLAAAARAFVAFGLAASSAYVLNDALDVERDRAHPRKRLRPFAAGHLPVSAAYVLSPGLAIASAAVAFALPPSFSALLAAYYATTVAYSVWLKRFAPLDVLVLAGLYTVRLYAGAYAVGVPISEWLATFSMFLFLSLAFLKRASELEGGAGPSPGRGYVAADREQIHVLGISSAYVAVLVLALYVSSADVARLYAAPRRLFLLCPLALYWVSRIWMQARRGEVHHDPLVHALEDPGSYVLGALAAAVVLLAV
jgi:4-hydroxybenzoate polyprenyltransferase